MNYQPPGNADMLTPELQQAWNQTILDAYNALAEFHSSFFALDYSQLTDADEVPVLWFGDPAEPSFCYDETVARNLSDWGLKGHDNLHNEYCEYMVSTKLDNNGRLRPKRVVVTTELREYWVCLARNDPHFVRALITNIMGREPSWQDLYGVGDPFLLSPAERAEGFSNQVAGDERRAIPPLGPLNRSHLLFMTHPINGLDDLLYIILFGAKPFAQMADGVRQPANKEQIFRKFDVEHLACRHADPAAAMAAHQQAYQGKTVAFANPLGVSIHAFTSDELLYLDKPVPEEWIRFSRGHQRLEFGPPDDAEVYLDDIMVVEGAALPTPLTGGYEVVKRIEVGPVVRVSQSGNISENDFILLDTSVQPITCREATVCRRIGLLKAEYEAETDFVRLGPRNMGNVR